ncbi:fungal-specific transcription factor domain-containing protein [Penicillium maclennaniae]|uniref:fungal-specific transcription factor domain-containing protein n=1 Tax=Penicillium maclennaniae TaxID=1343394 RepID=UPI0025413785|nr:fungal-specific transcription factor domain-containing protein [Penicillium maclennaniae]KAJ5675116.1 fungal-specific transcription factor domain-containing protein [Penicillium maclennaniae]
MAHHGCSNKEKWVTVNAQRKPDPPFLAPYTHSLSLPVPPHLMGKDNPSYTPTLMPLASDMESEVNDVPRGRQRPGAACDECRRRKLRCDGQQPQCGVCQDTGVVCEVTQRGVRGPKKGHLKALKNRVIHLEAMLESRLVNGRQDSQRGSSNDLALSVSPVDGRDGGAWIPKGTGSSGSDQEVFVSNSNGLAPDLAPLPHEWAFSSMIPANPRLPPSDIIQAELDQLYLDRVHQSIPILNQRRYLSWSKSNKKSATCRCLQYAMWTLASLLSVQFREMIEPLYQETKQMLEYLSVESAEQLNVNTKLGQAWVLVVTFEFMRAYHRTAWMSAGRAFRLVQAMRYHDIDSPMDKRGPLPLNGATLLKLRKDAACFGWPIFLTISSICTRLPAPDGEFQTGIFELGPFLSEAMTDLDVKVQSSFNECLILATICGRSLLQSQRYHISKAYGDMAMDGSEQRRWLDSILTDRLQILSRCYPSPTQSYDPLLLFANILGQATMIYFCKAMTETVADSTGPDHENPEIMNYQSRALEASTAIIRLTSTLRELPFTKVHPLMPIPIFLCAEYLYDEMHNEAFQMHIQELFHVLRELKNVNNPNQNYLDLLPQSCASKTVDIYRHSIESTPNIK